MTDEIDYVKRSQYRFKVVKSLDNDAKMPSQIARDTEIFQNHISNVLRQLREHDYYAKTNMKLVKRNQKLHNPYLPLMIGDVRE